HYSSEVLLRVDFDLLVFVCLVTFGVVSFLIAFVALVVHRAIRFAVWSFVTTAIAALIFIMALRQQNPFEWLINALLPSLVAFVAVTITMGRWGVCGLGIAYLISVSALFGYNWENPTVPVCVGEFCWLPWSITAFWSSIAAWLFIAIYLALYALFLQPYLGDAARYFRNSPADVAVRREIRKEAEDTLEDLHLSGKYDRIVVVAHSLGTVVAYDMLRAYYSRIHQHLPDPGKIGSGCVGSDFEIVDHQEPAPNPHEARNLGRAIIAKIVEEAQKPSAPGTQPDKAWLVTDFVTMGSPLAHAHYLMCDGETEDELKCDFCRRVREFEFPTCPPFRHPDKGDGHLTYIS